MTDIELFLASRDRLYNRTLLSSGFPLLLAAASRLPTWEVAAPVQWLVGTVNVGFLPIFGPIVIFGCYCFTILGYLEVVSLEKEIRQKQDLSGVERAILDNAGLQSRAVVSPRTRLAAYGMALWIFVVPLITYAVLVDSYFDFVRPGPSGPPSMSYGSRTGQVIDLLLGTGGWSGFKPATPSISDNLRKRADSADKKEEQARIRRVADLLPWIFPPFQTWAYIGGFFVMVALSRERWSPMSQIWRRRRIADNPAKGTAVEAGSAGSE